MYEQESLSSFYLRFQRKNAPVDAHRVRFSRVAEGAIIHRASVNSNRYGKVQTFAAPMPPKSLRHSASFEDNRFDGTNLNLRFESRNSTLGG